MHKSDDFNYFSIFKHIDISSSSLDEQAKLISNMKDFFEGVNLYHSHSYKRKKKTYKIVWKKGSTKLLDYSKHSLKSNYVFLMIPSLINKSYILDLKKHLSLMDYISAHHINCYLLDWGEPNIEEQGYKIEDFIVNRIKHVIEFLDKLHGKKIIVGGYCMGGIMALACAQIYDKFISKLLLIATPWNFSGMGNLVNVEFLAKQMENFTNVKKIPPQMVQGSFCFLDPEKVFSKFVKFSKLDQNSEEAENFVAVEKWINDGISVPIKVAHEFLYDFSSNNVLKMGKWSVRGVKINPNKIQINTYIALPINDRIVPLNSSLPLAEDIINKQVVMSEAGHIGLVVGRRAKDALWNPLVYWIKT